MKKVLVTGGAGFIGFHLIKRLLSEGFSVVSVDNINSYYDVLNNKIIVLDEKHDRDMSEVNMTVQDWIDDIDNRSTVDQLHDALNRLTVAENTITSLAEIIANGDGSGSTPGYHTQSTATIFPLSGYYKGTDASPLTTTDKTGYQRGEVYPFGLRLLFTNGKKSAVYHIPGREALPSDEILITTPSCNVYELTVSGNTCDEDEVTGIPTWKVYDTATILYEATGEQETECFEEIYASGDFAYWESTDTYPCNE